jgi:hypothetical protein
LSISQQIKKAKQGRKKLKRRRNIVTHELKEEFLKRLEENHGNISSACAKVLINRATYYKLVSNNGEFANKVDEINESLLDDAETALQDQIQQGNTSALIFYLKCKGKDRVTSKTPCARMLILKSKLTMKRLTADSQKLMQKKTSVRHWKGRTGY